MFYDEVMIYLKELSAKYNYRLGLAGSISRCEETSKSDIDIVTEDKNMPLEIMEDIKKDIMSKFNRDSDIICLELLKDEDKEFDYFALKNDLPINRFSAYKNIAREVKWCD